MHYKTLIEAVIKYESKITDEHRRIFPVLNKDLNEELPWNDYVELAMLISNLVKPEETTQAIREAIYFYRMCSDQYQ